MASKSLLVTPIGMAGILMITELVTAQQPGMSGHMSSMETMMQECQTQGS